MRTKIHKLLVTGGAGFIGSEFCRQAVKSGYFVVVLDKLTYAADLARLEEISGRYKFYKDDICNKKRVLDILRKEKPDTLVHFAAETHVDRSIKDASVFISTNVGGTYNLLEASRVCGINKFIHISTDEVYGDIKKGSFRENSPFCPNSPYAASKASADLLVRSYVRTYGFPAVTLRPSNNYGPWQYPEKLIPLAILRASRGRKVPVYAKGLNVREWLFVEDCAEAILLALDEAAAGKVYNIGSSYEMTNISVVKDILKYLNKPESLIEFVTDRPGHDIRYFLDSSAIRKDLGWEAKISFNDGIKKTIDWCMDNDSWLAKHKRKKLSIKFR